MHRRRCVVPGEGPEVAGLKSCFRFGHRCDIRCGTMDCCWGGHDGVHGAPGLVTSLKSHVGDRRLFDVAQTCLANQNPLSHHNSRSENLLTESQRGNCNLQDVGSEAVTTPRQISGDPQSREEGGNRGIILLSSRFILVKLVAGQIPIKASSDRTTTLTALYSLYGFNDANLLTCLDCSTIVST